MKKVLLLIPIAMSLVAATAIACSDDDEPPPTPTAVPTPAPLAISLQDNSFAPNALTARAGQEIIVNVKNDGQRPHSFTIDGVTDTGRIEAGGAGTARFTPTAAGALQYYCIVHGRANMFGTLNVTAGAVSNLDAGDAFAVSAD